MKLSGSQGDIPIDFQWLSIPAGEFLMGEGDEQHVVNLPAYRIARCPVTNAQYKHFVDSTGCELPEHWEDGRIPKGKEQHPVVFVSWRDAMAFSEWANVSLPTEAQWEKAARGVDGRTYPWAETEPTTDLCSFSSNDTTPVGAFSPQGDSPFGLVDVAGNVWEWTTSLWGGDPFDAQFVYPYEADRRSRGSDCIEFGVPRVAWRAIQPLPKQDAALYPPPWLASATQESIRRLSGDVP